MSDVHGDKRIRTAPVIRRLFPEVKSAREVRLEVMIFLSLQQGLELLLEGQQDCHVGRQVWHIEGLQDVLQRNNAENSRSQLFGAIKLVLPQVEHGVSE